MEQGISKFTAVHSELLNVRFLLAPWYSPKPHTLSAMHMNNEFTTLEITALLNIHSVNLNQISSWHLLKYHKEFINLKITTITEFNFINKASVEAYFYIHCASATSGSLIIKVWNHFQEN